MTHIGDQYLRDELTRDDVNRILEAAMPYKECYLFLRLLAKTGRRLGEIRVITAGDVDPGAKCLWTGIEKKRRKERRKVFLDETSLVLLQQYIQDNHLKREDKIFTASEPTLKRWPARFAKKAGLDKRISCHSFRRYVVTYLISKKWSYDQIQRITGHLDIGSLAHYDFANVEVVEPDFRAALNGL
jgi:integrase